MQKIIHSFQSLVIVEPKCLMYSEDYKNMDYFLAFLFNKFDSENNLVKKASEQVSFILFRQSHHSLKTNMYLRSLIN